MRNVFRKMRYTRMFFRPKIKISKPSITRQAILDEMIKLSPSINEVFLFIHRSMDQCLTERISYAFSANLYSMLRILRKKISVACLSATFRGKENCI